MKVGVHQGSVLSPLLFILVLETISREFRTGVSWELLYADDLVIKNFFEIHRFLVIARALLHAKFYGDQSNTFRVISFYFFRDKMGRGGVVL